MKITVFGLGEAGSLYAADLVAAGCEVHGYDPAPVPTPVGITRHDDPRSAVIGAEVVFALTSAADATGALTQALDVIPKTAVYADGATSSSVLKVELATIAENVGVRFATVALMSPVPGRGIGTPALASGSGAARFVELMTPLGMTVSYDGTEPGRAAARKLLRSVVMKGFAALVIESMQAAEAAGLADETWENLVTQITEADEAFIRRLVGGTAPHAGRRLHEMEATAELLSSLGVTPLMTRGTVESLRRIASGDSQPPELP